jgi:enamine deaminase RidA (YjgF/YER057c/UK114 family)
MLETDGWARNQPSHDGLFQSPALVLSFSPSIDISPTTLPIKIQSLTCLGGWKPEGPVNNISSDLDEEIDQAFANVDLNLRDAGGKGWSQVFRVNTYHVPLSEEAMGAVVRNFRKWMPDHQPLWTTIGVAKLGDDSMHVEIEVVAHDPEGAKKASEEGRTKKA